MTSVKCGCYFVNRYLDQFRDLFTEEGRRLVKITTSKPGQPEQVLFTAIPTTVPPTPIVQTPPTTSAPILKSAATVTDGSTNANTLGTKRNFPIQLSLSITPVSQGAATSLLQSQGAQSTGTITAQNMQTQGAGQRMKQLGLHQR